MATLFTRIINGELPGYFVWKDDLVVAFLTIAPVNNGHTLVVPRQEIDHWIDMPFDIAHRVMEVSEIVGRALQKAFNPAKVGVMVAGLEVPHVHYHLIPIQEIADLNFARQNPDCPREELENAARAIRDALKQLGFEDGVEEATE